LGGGVGWISAFFARNPPYYSAVFGGLRAKNALIHPTIEY